MKWDVMDTTAVSAVPFTAKMELVTKTLENAIPVKLGTIVNTATKLVA